MPDNYDNICSLCGKVIEEVAYHCCSECHRMHKKNKQVDIQGDKDDILNARSVVPDVSN